jgi:hypothetical protein
MSLSCELVFTSCNTRSSRISRTMLSSLIAADLSRLTEASTM